MPDMFLSYSRRDKRKADRLVKDLRAHGIAVWFDENEILVGHSIVDRVYDGIRNSTFLAVLLTPHSIRSKWVKEELTFARTREIEEGKVVVLPLLFEDCAVPDALRAKRYADFRKSYPAGLSELKRVLTPAVDVGSPGERKIELEDIFESTTKRATTLAKNMLQLQQNGEMEYTLDFTNAQLYQLQTDIGLALNKLDYLISLEDSPRLLFRLFMRGADLASRILDYKRELQYLESILELGKVNVNTLMAAAVAGANAGFRARAIDLFRRALRRYLKLTGNPETHDDERPFQDALLKFTYAVTRQVRIEEIDSVLFRDVIIFRDRQTLVDRLERTMDTLEEAFRRELIFDLDQPTGSFNYGVLLNYIGLTKRALTHFSRARELGCKDSAFDRAGIDLRELKREIRRMERSIRDNGEAKVQCTSIQLANFCVQFGSPPDHLEALGKNAHPTFYSEVIANTNLFTLYDAT